jgi:hypothetical protein
MRHALFRSDPSHVLVNGQFLASVDGTSALDTSTRTYAGVSDRSEQRTSACLRLSM